MNKKYVYDFKEGNASMRELLGGKGANLAEMTNMGLPVPQGFTVTTEACTKYYEDGKMIANEIIEEIESHLKALENLSGKKFGDPSNPLLVSVRSGARASMPGMMDTILNLGLNVEVVRGFAKKTGTEKFIPKIKEGFQKTMYDNYNVDYETSDKLIVNFIKVIEDASSYLFSKNHSARYNS